MKLSKIENSKYIPTGISAIKATISVIPWVGGALNHLIFDKADEIRISNIEKAVNNISKTIIEIQEHNIDIGWFETSEAIQMFKKLIEKIEFEQSNEKINILSDIYCISGTTKFSDDPNKFAVLQKLSELTTVQIEILKIINNVGIKERKFEGRGLASTATAIWADDIVSRIKEYEANPFWKGTLDIVTEIEIIESFNLIRRTNTTLARIKGYSITGLGLLILNYLKQSNV